MVSARFWLTIALLSAARASLAAAEAPPPVEIVQAWWAARSSETLSIDSELVPIVLRSGERAFLASAGFYSRGRNDFSHVVLIRPALKEVREVPDPVRQDFSVRDLDHDGVSEIVAQASGSGGGSIEGVMAIVQMDGWTPIVLHRAAFHNNLGNCGRPPGGYGKCRSVEVKWRFEGVDGGGTDVLVEEIVTAQGWTADNLKLRRHVRRYLFKQRRFVPLTESGLQSGH